MGVSQESMDQAEHFFCLPVVMLINFALFQYLAVLYFRRRSESLIILLLFCAFLGFATIIPQAHPNDEIVGHLNDISETCSILTFLIQITVIGRDIAKKVRIWSLKLLTFVAQLLTLFGLLVVLLNFVEVLAPRVDVSRFNGVDNIMEIAGLVYIFFFRFYYIAISRGFKWMMENKKAEIFLYVLFMTHELPFMVLESGTRVTWEPVQAIWHRLTLMMCILMTVKEKLTSKRTRASRDGASTAFSRGPPRAFTAQDEDDDDEKQSTKVPRKKRKLEPKTASSSSKKTTIATSMSRVSNMMRSGLSSMRLVSASRSGSRVGVIGSGNTGGRAVGSPGRVMNVVPGPERPS